MVHISYLTYHGLNIQSTHTKQQDKLVRKHFSNQKCIGKCLFLDIIINEALNLSLSCVLTNFHIKNIKTLCIIIIIIIITIIIITNNTFYNNHNN